VRGGGRITVYEESKQDRPGIVRLKVITSGSKWGKRSLRKPEGKDGVGGSPPGQIEGENSATQCQLGVYRKRKYSSRPGKRIRGAVRSYQSSEVRQGVKGTVPSS